MNKMKIEVGIGIEIGIGIETEIEIEETVSELTSLQCCSLQCG